MGELSALMVEHDDSNEEFSLSVRILLAILILSSIGFSAYVVLKTWIKAWKDKVKWVRVLTKALFIVLSMFTLFVLWFSYELNS